MSYSTVAYTSDDASIYLDREEVQYVLGYVGYRRRFIAEYQVLVDFIVQILQAVRRGELVSKSTLYDELGRWNICL